MRASASAQRGGQLPPALPAARSTLPHPPREAPSAAQRCTAALHPAFCVPYRRRLAPQQQAI
eukprot:4259390-Pleurochrysis_carterae.AAC.1